ncbi:MAG: hypothetical protein PVI51_07780, partial [candidate division WOR-3 bacterium]
MILTILAGVFALAPPTGVNAYDTPNDGGGRITVEWQLSPDDATIEGYEIYRRTDGEAYELAGFIGRGRARYEDETEDGITYVYKVAALRETERGYSDPSPPAASKPH